MPRGEKPIRQHRAISRSPIRGLDEIAEFSSCPLWLLVLTLKMDVALWRGLTATHPGGRMLPPKRRSWQCSVTPIFFAFLGLLIGLAVIAACVPFWRDDTAYQVSCPKCDRLCKLGTRPLGQIVCAVLLFRFGLLTFLAGRLSTVCRNCGHRWITEPDTELPTSDDARLAAAEREARAVA